MTLSMDICLASGSLWGSQAAICPKVLTSLAYVLYGPAVLVRKVNVTEDSITSNPPPLWVSEAEGFSQQKMLQEQSGGSPKKGNKTTDF